MWGESLFLSKCNVKCGPMENTDIEILMLRGMDSIKKNISDRIYRIIWIEGPSA
jgi:hypothetical protein